MQGCKSITYLLPMNSTFAEFQVSDQDNVKVIDTTVQDQDEYDTYPPPDKDFKYEDPYVTDEEMLQVMGNKDQGIKPRKPASAYFFYVKKHQCQLKLEHPGWPMKKIVKVLAANWSKTSDEERQPFKEMAKEDSQRYAQQMTTFSKSNLFKKMKKIRQKQVKIKHQIRSQETKDTLAKEAFEMFALEHGGTLDEKKALWNETDDNTKNEYFEKASQSAQVLVTTRSKRQVKLPSKLSESSSSSSRIKSKNQGSFDQFVKAKKCQDPALALDKIKAEWNLLSLEEKAKYETSSNAMNYKALDEGDMFFQDSEDDNEDDF